MKLTDKHLKELETKQDQASACCANDACSLTEDPNTNETQPTGINTVVLAIFSFVLLITGLVIEHVWAFSFFDGWIKLAWYGLAYIPVGYPVLIAAVDAIKKGGFFTEFFLMSIATIGAFLIGEYAEGVAVMLFYTVGELFQAKAVSRAKNNIKALLDVRSKIAHVYRNNLFVSVHPKTVNLGEKVQIKVGERIPLDGVLLTDKARLDTVALTGESKPTTVYNNEKVFAGTINLTSVIEIEVTALFKDSSISKILALVQNATTKKAKTELLLRKVAKIYTSIVVYLAIAITILPYFFVSDYLFSEWLYRALVFLVISCPCALVISIPLGYFGGLGAASKQGILFKGATYMELISKVNTVVMDKTGTLTKGVFSIQKIVVNHPFSERELMRYVISLEKNSNHPIAKALFAYPLDAALYTATKVQEIGGKGLLGTVHEKRILVGNKKLLQQYGVTTPPGIDGIIETTILIAIDHTYAGHIVIADALKEDAIAAIKGMRKAGIKKIIMLSGDQESITQKVAKSLGIQHAKGGLLPEDKLKEVTLLLENTSTIVAFIGDGINDAPVLAASHVGIAMGGMGSDVAIETADVIFQTDEPTKFMTALQISKATQRVIRQNIYLAFGVKFIILTLGALGMANLWGAVFSDVGVALLAILNAVRLQYMKWDTNY
ncbi:MAG: cadmium-translocating P-type ATPase [Flavobacteriaceae bacterium]|nr:MAG: cadmium-translocating P-type ATPase [Flavobacteriaceae bacterium]